ncbi:MAG: hypothetical protein H0U51_03285 [Propionibacteriales bacterium]|nr:hypothetical protein [Propionibacteriales bacterium]
MPDTTSSTTRRALLGGAGLAAAVVVAEVVRPSAAQAADGDPLLAGRSNHARFLTSLINDTDLSSGGDGAVLYLQASYVDGSALEADNYSTTDPAIKASARRNHGIIGQTYSDYYSGVSGRNFGGTGVNGSGTIGVSGSGGRRGVEGNCVEATGTGVYGWNDGGGFGVAGESDQPGGIGVQGTALGVGGVALRGVSTNRGTALKVEGKARFSRSGKKTIPAGSLSATVTLAGVNAASLILATLQQHAAGFTVESAVAAADSFTIWLNQPAPTGGLSVGWFVIN